MGFVGSEPSQASVSSAGILDGAIVDADINASAAIAISKTAFSAGTGVTLSTNTLNIDAAQTGITSLLATNIKIGEDDQTKIDFEDDNKINFYANNAKEIELAENSLSPGTSDGTALGTTSLMWSDLFLASGSVINFNNGDVTLTHSGNTLTVAGGTLATATITASTSIDITGSAGLILENDETITNSTNGTVLINGIVAGGTGSGAGVFQSNGDHDVTLQTGNSTTGTITITDGANGDVAIAPNGTGKLTSTGDVDVFRDANDADVALRLGTAAAESLTIQVLNGGSNKTAEEVHFSSATASATGDHGKMVFDIDGTDILTIDDGGLVIKTTGTIGPVGDEDLVTLTASGSIVTVAGELSVTTLDIGGTDVTSTAAELNILDGVNTTASELNLLDGSAKSTSSITIADSDAFIVIDGTTTKQIPASDIASYAGGGGGSFDAVANGDISAADLVALESDGKVMKVKMAQTGKAVADHTNVDTGATSGYYAASGYDPDNNKMAVYYRDSGNSNYPTIAIIGVTDASDGSIAAGTPVVLDTTAAVAQTNGIAYDTSVDRFVVPYSNGNGLQTVVFYCSNTSTNAITKGSAQVIEAGDQNIPTNAVYDSAQSRVIIGYQNSGSGQCCRALNVTGGSTNNVSAGAELEWDSTNLDGDNGWGMGYDSNDGKTMIVFRDIDNSNYLTVVAITTDGSNCTQGTHQAITSTAATGQQPATVVHDPDTNINVAFDASIGSVCFTSSSGSITAGTTVDRTALGFDTTSNPGTFQIYHDGYYDTNNDRVVMFNGYRALKCLVGHISGTGSGAKFVPESLSDIDIADYYKYVACEFMTTSNKGIVFYIKDGDGYEALMPNIPLNDSSFIGFANDAISDTATGTITTIGGVATGQSSLSIGSDYYVTNAALTTTSGTVFAGRALTATTLLVGFNQTK